MYTVVSVLLFILSLFVLLFVPFVGYPLARVLKGGRQAIDNALNWKGKYTKVLENIEDGCTYFVFILLGILVCVVVGAMYVWYVQTTALSIHTWLVRLISDTPVVGNQRIGLYHLAFILYWSIGFLFAYIFGWIVSVRKRSKT